jgi:hypothetical protein
LQEMRATIMRLVPVRQCVAQALRNVHMVAEISFTTILALKLR